MTFRYPTTEYDQPAVLLELLGTFWSDTYADKVVEDLMVSYALAARQSHADMLQLVDACGRRSVPIFHRQQWYNLVLKASEQNRDAGTSIRAYGGGIVYGNQADSGAQLKYGVPWFPYSTFPLPADLTECRFIFNRLTRPSVSLVLGVDFIIDIENQVIVFKDDPFTNDGIAKRDVYADGVVTEQEVSLWLFRPAFDENDTYTQFAYPLAFSSPSSSAYRNTVNGLWDALVRGAAVQDIESVVSAICDVPLAKGTEEVEVIFKDNNHRVIATDQHVYLFDLNVTVIVAVGDTITAGQPLTNAVQFYEFNHGDSGDLQAVTIGPSILPDGYYDSITFYNETVALEVDTSDVFAKVSFHVGGWPGDVEQFWNEFHEKGVAQGNTLAQLLDERSNKVGEPTAANLPATINPLKFAVKNILRNNVFAVKIVFNLLGSNALSIRHFRQLRRFVVPSTMLLIITELMAPEDVVTLTEYAEEEQDSYSASEPYQETFSIPSFVEEGTTLQHIEGYCI